MSLIDPRVTVIIPTYNHAHIISRSIRSVLEQTYRDFELLVVDDASTDNTAEVVASFTEDRIKYIRLDRNSGTPAIPTNEGIKIARGDYIAIQDSDDEWLPSKLEKQMNVFKTTSPNVGVVYTDMWRVSGNGLKEHHHPPRIIPEDGIIYREALGYRVEGIGTQTLLIRKECFKKTGLFDERLRMFIDTEFLIRLSKYYYFHHLPEPLVNYYDTPGSLVHHYEAWLSAWKLILEKFFEDIKKSRRLLAKHYFMIGHYLCSRGEYSHGRSYLMKSIWVYPMRPRSLFLIFLSLLFHRGYYAISNLMGVPKPVAASLFFK